MRRGTPRAVDSRKPSATNSSAKSVTRNAMSWTVNDEPIAAPSVAPRHCCTATNPALAKLTRRTVDAPELCTTNVDTMPKPMERSELDVIVDRYSRMRPPAAVSRPRPKSCMP
jgi:hypothetical protein